ncbi:MAG: hypothetical protein HC828_11315 [Blastochloris sp.]|nr:hypothetical protein [Blastochloris sp.]
MSEKLGSVLIAEVGSITTRVTLIDSVEGETRLIGQAEAATSMEPPYEDVLIGILEGAARIADATGRQLLRDGRLMKPQNNERDGINHVLVTTSAAGNLALIIAGIARDVSARSALHAARSTYTAILQTVTLDDAVLHPELQRTSSWVERQVQTMLALQPDAIVLAGGLEQGAKEVLCRLARIIGFSIEHMAGANQQHSRRSRPAFPVIYAGNTEARQCVQQALGNRAEVRMVDNLRPTMEDEQLEGVRHELVRLYEQRMLQNLPGSDSLAHLCSAPVTTACHMSGVMTRFLSERYWAACVVARCWRV